jgi:type III restriction enzyme
MSASFFERPILNPPYEYPSRHWELDADGQPTNKIVESRRKSRYISPVPQPKKRKINDDQAALRFNNRSDGRQEYDPTPFINEIRAQVDAWRKIQSPSQWQVTAETERLLKHWRHHQFQSYRPFFCQVEAVETAIWLTEVAPKLGKSSRKYIEILQNANKEANPELFRIALKMATGAGKTTVMAMMIAWQAINAIRHPDGKMFTRGFLIVTPGITIKDRLRALQPNDPDSYYRTREIVPADMAPEIMKVKIVITNYHAFKLRDRIDISKTGRALLKGRGPDLMTKETEGQMLQRVAPELMGMKNVLVINDEAHHCYREKAGGRGKDGLKGEEKKEGEKNNEIARLWISGIEIVKRKLGVNVVWDLSATPFFLRGSGYREGTLFHWTASDFSLMDAIESGVVKLPRVPVADNVPGGDTPKFRNLWEHIGSRLPKKGRKKSGADMDPLSLPVELQTALEALYGHYNKTFELWEKAEIGVPPVFIVVCNNTSTSKLVYDFISGFEREPGDGGERQYNAGRLPLFRNYDEQGAHLPRPRTLLIDSEQLESGEALHDDFREMAAGEIESFRREIIERTGDRQSAEKITDQDLLREVMNTVGKKGRLGESIRCVVSVSMLTEGWDVNTVTHVLGVRAFGTQLLCEQVVGRALRRQSYELNEEGLFNPEYADVFGIPFDFTTSPVVAPPTPPRETVTVKAEKDREALEIRFPRVDGYRVELPEERLAATFNQDSTLELNPALVGPSTTHTQGIIGESAKLTLDHLKDMRQSTIVYHLTRHLLYTKYRDPGEEPKLYLFGQLKRIARHWVENHLHCAGGTYPAQLLYQEIADMACEKIKAAIAVSTNGNGAIKAVMAPYNPTGSTRHVNFTTSRTVWKTDMRRCHLNYVVCDSDWEAEFCRVAENHPRVKAYTKNQNLGLEVPYLLGSTQRRYLPDFIVLVDDGCANPLNLIVEIKGYRGEDAKVKKETMEAFWIPGVNNQGKYGRWAFAEFTHVFDMEKDFGELIEKFSAGRPA